MTPSEARDYIIRHCNPDYPHGKTEWETAINMAIEALSKEMPQKPTKSVEQLPNESLYKMNCPTCGTYIGYGNSKGGTLSKFTCVHDRRGHCGQKLQW